MSNFVTPNGQESRERDMRWRYLGQLIKFGVSAVLAIVGISLAVAAGRFTEAFDPAALKLAPYPQMSFILLIVTFALIGLWYFAVEGELRMLRLYAFEFIPPIPNIKLQLLILIALLGIMAYFSDRPIVYSSIFVSFKLMEIWLSWIREHEMRKALEKASEQLPLDGKRRRALKAIEKYYFERPQLPLAVTVLCLAFLALVLSVYGKYGNNERLAFSIAYSLLLAGIFINEIVYQWWRAVRDRVLGERFS